MHWNRDSEKERSKNPYEREVNKVYVQDANQFYLFAKQKVKIGYKAKNTNKNILGPQQKKINFNIRGN